MLSLLANTLVTLLGIYVLLGILFAVPFILRGVNRIDPLAGKSTVGFRLLVFPGSVALWPLLAKRWLWNAPPPQERNPHRDRAHSEASA
jgi:hypothetical protein